MFRVLLGGDGVCQKFVYIDLCKLSLTGINLGLLTASLALAYYSDNNKVILEPELGKIPD